MNVRLLERPHRVLGLGAVEPAVRAGREFVRAALGEWRVARLADDAVLVTSELVTNSVRRATLIKLGVCLSTDAQVALEVWDDNPEAPVRGAADLSDVGGRGIAIVAALASDWGCRPAGGGKVVWAVVGEGAAADPGARQLFA